MKPTGINPVGFAIKENHRQKFDSVCDLYIVISL